MKRIITLLILLGIFCASLLFHNEIVNFFVDSIENFDKSIKSSTKLITNDYSLKKDFNFVRITNNFSPKNENDIKNIYYTILDSGMNNFTFYCSKEYKNCIDHIDYISNNQKLLSYINDYTSVYNSFKNIETEFDSLGKVTIRIQHAYSNEEIEIINQKIEEIKNNYLTDDMDIEKIIKTIHDYIIKNTKYDKERADNKNTTYHSDIAYGPLIEGYAICGGYADSMKLFLDLYHIPNFKVSSENHIWNALLLNGKWLHIDLTWDDPITSTGEDILDYNYFLIDTNELHSQEKEQHIFDDNIYLEFKEA